MIILDSTLKQLEISLSTTPNIPLNWVSSWVEIGSNYFMPVSLSGTISSTSIIITAPTASKQIQAKFISIYNASNSNNIISVNYNDNSNLRVLGNFPLESGDTLYYIDSKGFEIIDSNGSIRSGIKGATGSNLIINGISDNIQYFTSSSDSNISLNIDSLSPTHSFNMLWSGILPISRGGSGTSSTFPSGSIIFSGSDGKYSYNNQLYWDNASNKLCVGTTSAVESITTIGNVLSSGLHIYNPTKSYKYLISGTAISLDRNISLPLLTSNDTFVFESFSQSITNKTLLSTNNNVIDATKLQTFTVSTSVPNDGDLLIFTNGQWVPKKRVEHASCYVVANATATTILSTATYYKASCTTTSGNIAGNFSHPSSNRVQWDGSETITVDFSCFWTLNTTTNGTITRGRIHKNGTAIAESEIQSSDSTNGYTNGNSQGFATMSNGDYLELYVRNTSATSNVTLISMNLKVRKIS